MYAVVKCGILALSMLGFVMFYQRKRLPLCFFPITAASGITALVYIAGLLGVLKIGCYAVVALGMLLLIRFFNRKQIAAFLSDWSTWYVIFAFIWLYVITRGTMLADYDEGTHWYRICKSMHYENAFPSTPDIFFFSYLPGCQTWVYFVTRFIGFSIPNCFFAQNILNIFCVATLFAVMEKAEHIWDKVFSAVIIAGAGILLCCMSVSTYSLLVDTQLGLTAMAALIFMIGQGERKETIVPITMILVFLALIKNSALMFVFMVFIWSVIRYRFEPKTFMIRLCVWVGIPLLFYFFYKVRSGMVYAGKVPAQSISIQRFMNSASNKEPAVVWEIIQKVFQKTVLCGTRAAPTLYGSLVLLTVLSISAREDDGNSRWRECLQVLKGLFLTLLLYTICLIGIYVFSFDLREAQTLSGFWRYYGTILIVITGLAVYTGLSEVMQKNQGKILGMGIMFMFVFYMPGAFPKTYIYGSQNYLIPEEYRSDIWRAMEIAVPQNSHYTEDSYLILWDTDDFIGGSRDNGRVSYIAGAWLRSNNIDVISSNDLRDGSAASVLETIDRYDYLAIISDMSEFEEMLSKYLGEAKPEIGFHQIH